MEYNLYYYYSILDAVVMKDKEENELVIVNVPKQMHRSYLMSQKMKVIW